MDHKNTKLHTTIQMSHAGAVLCVAPSPDGSLLASGSQRDSLIKLWNAETASLIRNFIGHQGKVMALVFSADGKSLFSVGSDGKIRLWDVSTGQLITHRKAKEWVQAMVLKKENQIITAGNKGVIKIWDFQDQGPHAQMNDPLYALVHAPEKHPVFALALSQDGRYLASGGADGKAILWDLEERKQVQEFIVSNQVGEFVHALALGPGSFPSRLLAGTSRQWHNVTRRTGSKQKPHLLCWNLSTTASSQAPRRLTGHEDDIYSLALTQDGRYLVSGSGDATIGWWDLQNKQAEPQFKWKGRNTHPIACVKLSADEQFLYSGSYSTEVKKWRWDNEVEKSDIPAENKADLSYEGHAAMVYCSVITPDNRYLFEGSQGNAVMVWDLENGKMLGNLNEAGSKKHPGAEVKALDISRNGRWLAVGSTNRIVKIWDLERFWTLGVVGQANFIAPRLAYDFKLPVRSLRFGGDSKHLAVGVGGGGKGQAWIWAIGDAKPKMLDEKPINYGCTVDLHMEAGVLVVAYDLDKDDLKVDLSLIDINTSQKVDVKGQHGSRIRQLSISKDGKFFATACQDGRVRVFDLQQKQKLKEINLRAKIKSKSGWLVSIDISRDGRYLFVGNRDANVYIIDVARETVIQTLIGHESEPFVRLSPDESYLITASLDSSTRIWQADWEAASLREEIVQLVSMENRDWVVMTPGGLFDASAGAMEKMHFVQGLEAIALDQLKKRYYEPGLLEAIWTDEGQGVRDVTDLQIVPLFPLVTKAEVKEEILYIGLKEREGGLGKVWIKVNGKEIIEDANPDRKTQFAVPLEPYKQHFRPATWDNQIDIITFNEEGWLRSKSHLIAEYWPTFVSGKAGKRALQKQRQKEAGQDLQLFAVFIGTSKYELKRLQLDYPDLDVTRLAGALKAAGEKLFQKTHVKQFVSTPTDGQELATKANIEKALAGFAKEAKEKDVMLLFLSGHGDTHGTGENSEFYYLMKDLKDPDLRSKQVREEGTISTRELTNWIKGIAARKQVMILDACNSGKFIKGIGKKKSLGSTQQRALEEMKDRTGMWVLAGSADSKESFENYALGQGILTYSLLKGIKGAALRSDDEQPKIDVQQLLGFAMSEVPKLAKRAGREQEPVLSIPKDGGSTFSLGLADDDIRKQIQLPDPKPIFTRSTFLDSTTFCDTIDLSSALDRLYKLEQTKWLSKTGEAEIVFVDVSKFPDAYYLSGIYTKKKNEYEVEGYIFKDKKAIHRTAMKLVRANAQELALAIEQKVKQIMKGIKKK